MADVLVKVLRQRHKDYNEERLHTICALYEGGQKYRDHLAHILPRNHAEPPDVYRDRKKHAAYFNHMGGLLNLTVGHLFAEPVQLEGGGAYWGEFGADVDRKGSSWSSWWAKAMLDALQFRQSFALVLPPPDADQVEADNLADQQKAGALDAFLTHISGEDVIDWGEDPRGNLQWIMRETQDWVRPAPDKPAVCVWKWTYVDHEVIRVWTWVPERATQTKPPGNAKAKEEAEVLHGLEQLPLVRLGLPAGIWMGDKLHDPALSLTRGENDHRWSLYKAAHAMMVIKADWGMDKKPVLGPGYYMKLERGDEVSYAEPSGVSFSAMREDVKDRREEMHRVVQQMAVGQDSSASQQRASAEAKGLDWKAEEIMLSAYAGLVLSAMQKTAELVSEIRSTEPPVVSGLDGWQEEGTDVFLERAALAIDARQMSPLFRKVVAKREVDRILGDEVDADVIEAIKTEIDEAVVEEAGTFQPTPMDGEDEDDDEGNQE